MQCDGVVAGTPAGSSAYSLAAGGPLLGISVDAYVISLVAAHAVGVRPVVAAPMDVLEIINQRRARLLSGYRRPEDAATSPGRRGLHTHHPGHDLSGSPGGRQPVPPLPRQAAVAEDAVLSSLTIRNFVLIEDAVLEFAPGLNVLTGETGAGKTLLTKALGLLMGERAEDGLVGSRASDASIQAVFESGRRRSSRPTAERSRTWWAASSPGRSS